MGLGTVESLNFVCVCVCVCHNLLSTQLTEKRQHEAHSHENGHVSYSFNIIIVFDKPRKQEGRF